MSNPTIIYTKTDEAPALATAAFLPIVEAYTKKSGINIEVKDISLAARILALFPDYINPNQICLDALGELEELVKQPHANIIKLPNISASMPQLIGAIQELQKHGFKLPDYPENPSNDKESEIKTRYDKVKGSAVNPVLREGNSDRRAPKAVKNYAKNNPHSMGEWKSDSKTHVSYMTKGDFYGSEKSIVLPSDTTVQILLDGEKQKTILKESLPLIAGEILDGAIMEKEALREFLAKEISSAKKENILFSIHLKATMMKVSDPIIFGHAVSVYFAPVFKKFEDTFNKLGVDPNNGMGDLLKKIEVLDNDQQKEITDAIDKCYKNNADLAMVNSDKGITNLHVPSDVIIDASMPAAIRAGGIMWDSKGKERDMKAVIPDRAYAGIYDASVKFCKEHGAFDPSTMGSVSNVGLMAQKAEEYGSHDKTFEIPESGTVRIIDQSGSELMTFPVKEGDIFRMCQAKDAPIQDWVKLAVKRARATGTPTVFWLDENRAHDREIQKKVETYLPEHDTEGLELSILSPVEATIYSMERMKKGLDTVSVTGNVLRDYLTDLFPILEVGTSAKMLSIVPLMNGGGLFETGAGGSAPKHVQQFLKENHLRWDSLGEYLALTVSLEHLAETVGTKSETGAEAILLANALDKATESYLDGRKGPSRKVNEADNRSAHFYIALYWAQALATQDQSKKLKDLFAPIAKKLTDGEKQIVDELIATQGKPAEIGGYYNGNKDLIEKEMRPSALFNQIIASV